ncbi:MAG: SET domain-containing protein [Pirellulaceae bacterium]
MPPTQEISIARHRDSEIRAVRPAPSREVRVGRARTGKGVFAQKRYRPDCIIGEIQGDLIDDPNYGSNYCLDLEDGRILEPWPPFRFLNHSCEPNCEFDLFDLANDSNLSTRRRVFLLAMRPIACGEELTIDYSWAPDAAIPCRCQAATCRQWIVRASQLPQWLARINA